MAHTQTNRWMASLSLCLFFAACTKQDISQRSSDKNFSDAAKGGPSNSMTLYALTNDNMLVQYSGHQNFKADDEVSITGLQSGEKVLAIDFRPATGQLYGVTDQSRLYVINQNTGGAIAVSMTPFSPAINGDHVGFDFNPTVDRIRLVTDKEQNLRLNPETGAVAATDGTINPGDPSIVAAAYTNNMAGAASTTLYTIDVKTDKLFIQNPPNNGTQVEVGSLGLQAEGEGGFDIAPGNNEYGIAVLYSKGGGTMNENAAGSNGFHHRFYVVDLATGNAKNAGKAKENIIGLAIPTQPVAYSVNGGSLLIFNPFNTSSVVSKTISGLQMGETIMGIDMRPANGQLYGLGSSNRLYTINMSSGAAAVVGSGFTPALNGTQFGFDFNPTVDRIRVVSNTGQNLRLHPLTGASAATDGVLNPGMPMVDGAAYANNFAGATATILYDLDYGTDALMIQNPPNAGTLSMVGSLGINADAGNGFDIGGTTGNAYALLNVGGMRGIYSINLSTGAATKISDFGMAGGSFAVGLGF